MENMKNNFTFIDLFSGIGGFHQAMAQLGGKCVLSSEIDSSAIATYKKNYKIDSNINIRDIDANDVPDHDVLCAGFPCQAFSKAGKQLGFADETKGTLFFEIERILKVKKPRYIILENVRNLVSHDSGKTWITIKNHLKSCGYRLTEKPMIVSPHYFNIPQLRERVVIMGVYDPEHIEDHLNIDLGHYIKKENNSINSILENGVVDKKYYISEYEYNVLNAWNDFYQHINLKVIGFPIWVDAFKESPREEYPEWKNNFIRKNNDLYKENKDFIDAWLIANNNLENWVPTHKKFEWQAGANISSIWEGIIQMRPSGIRVKTPNCFPALVAMVQIPIIGSHKRRLTVREAARLQSFPDEFIPDTSDQQAYKQFGNAVNVEVIKRCAEKLFEY